MDPHGTPPVAPVACPVACPVGPPDEPHPILLYPDAEGLRVHQFRSLELNGEFVRARHGHGATSGDTP